MKQLLTAAIGTALTLIAGMALPAPPTARAGAVEPTSWGKANLISYADSDFESGVGTWINYSNSTLSQDSTQAFHGQDALKMVAGTSGSQAAKALGDGSQINVTGGDTYRVSAWVKAVARSGRAVTFAGGFYDSSGNWIGWASGSTVTLNNSGGWQYVSDLITAQPNASFMKGSPRLTEAGVNAGEALDVDEVLVEPYRAATLIGAKDPSPDGSQWASANSAIGPLQVDKVFYGVTTALPTSYGSSLCADIPSTVTCVLAYKVADTNVASFVRSIPGEANTILVWYQEPEGNTFSSCEGVDKGSNGANFVCEFEHQADLIHANVTSANRANVWIAMDGGGYQYGTRRNGAECAFIPPSSYVDFYFEDHYEDPANGNSLANYGTAEQDSEWTNWIGCVGPQNRPIGLGEFGLNCHTSPYYANGLTTQQAMGADNAFLQKETFTDTNGKSYTRPVVDWMYWWYDNGGTGCQFTTGGNPDGTQAVQRWQANETQNGGGAN